MKSFLHKLSYQVYQTDYFSNEGLRLLSAHHPGKFGSFDHSGKELCIAILNYNRVELTIKLLQSVEMHFSGFEGEILIVENNSAEGQVKRLEEFISTSALNINVARQSENQGVARARNIAANSTAKNWIMFIDSDMYFISNPLQLIGKTIEILGVSFLNLPIIDHDRESVFALGGTLFISPLEGELMAGGGSAFSLGQSVSYNELQIEQPFLSDFLFGGAAVLDRNRFLELGGFEHGMFIGFEDTDFSMRLYQKGIKVGNIPAFTVVHDHKLPVNNEDLKSEKERYSNDIIRNSGEVFYKKHGIRAYDAYTQDWLKEKQQQISGEKKHIPESKKPTVTLVADKRNWAFHHIAKNIMADLSEEYSFTLIFSEDYVNESWTDLYTYLIRNKTDIVYFFWRPTLFLMNSAHAQYEVESRRGVTKEEFDNFLNTTVLLTSVYDHLFLKAEQKELHADSYYSFIDGYTVSSELLNRIYSEEFPKKPFCTIQDGVDLNVFTPKTTTHSEQESLTVGWVGNSVWGMADDGIDHKGFNSIIRPVVEQLNNEGYNINLKYADSNEPSTRLSHSEMPGFYKSVDVYICMSDIEGTPNTVLEAMASGCAVISTEVGIVKEAMGKLQKDFVMESRSREELSSKLKQLYGNRELQRQLGAENIIRIHSWSWKNKTELFDLFFSAALKRGPKIKREVLQTTPGEGHPETEMINFQKQVSDNESYKVSRLIRDNEETVKKMVSVQEWYNQEYECLPLWYKRFGHLIKIVSGKRPVRNKAKNSR